MILSTQGKTAVKVLISLAAVFISLNLFISCKKKTDSVLVKYQYPDDIEMWNHIYSSSSAFLIPEKLPEAIIIPHHDITASQQNSFYKALSKVGQPSVVVIIAPDHFETGKKQIVIPCNTEFDAPDGMLKTADYTENFLQNETINQYVDVTSIPWKQEHGIYIHTPFIKHYFPEARIFPILLKSFSEEEEFNIYRNLGAFLKEILPEDSLVIASVDFSHYQIPAMTNLHDYVTMNTLQNSEELTHVEVDSPETLTAVTEYAKLRGALEPVLIHRTSTYDFIPDEYIVSTSHQYWTYYSTADLPLIESYANRVLETNQRYSKADYSKKNQTILIGGSGKIGAGVRYEWKWDRYKKSKKNTAENRLYNLAGTEARFLTGFDALVFDIMPGEEYKSNKHGTPLFIKGITWEDIKNEELKSSRASNETKNQINILVITADELLSDFKERYKDEYEESFITLGKLYEIIVVRDNTGSYDSYCILSETKDLYNLGILCGKNHSKGNILCINWYDGVRTLQLFDYESATVLPPAIHQGDF